ncbi:MAG: hypothetical protein ABI813_00310 [Bacteroidota bacterium]
MPFYIVMILISFLASVIGLLADRNRVSILIAFSFFLLLSAFIEIIGWRMSSKYYNTIALYNFFTLFEFIFYLFFFRAVLTGGRIRKTILVVLVIYTAAALTDIFFIQKGAFHTYTYVLGCIIMVIFSIAYFYFLFRFPEKGSLARNPYFWIGIALMFYYTCTFSLYGLENFITEKMRYYNRLLFLVSDLLNISLYTLFSIGFLCKINIRKLSASS